MAFRNLSAEIKGDATSYVAATSRAERAASRFGREATALSAQLQLLQGRADEAGDELADVGRESSQATRRFVGLTGATFGLIGAFSGLAGTSTGVNVGMVSVRVGMLGLTGITLALTGAVTALVSALIPLAAILGTLTVGLGALAGAFSTVIGTGILAFGAERGRQNRQRLRELEEQIDLLETRRDSTLAFNPTLKERLETLKEERDTLEDQTGIWGGLSQVMGELQEQIQPIIVGFGQQFIPLIRDAVEALPQFVQNVVDAIGGTERLASAVRAFGEGIFDIGPDFAAFIFEAANDAMPVMEDFLRWLVDNGGDIWSGMLETTRELAPVFLDFFDTFMAATPELNELGSMVLETIVPAFGEFISIVEDLLNMAFESDSVQEFISKLAPDLKAGFQSVFEGLGDLGATLAPIFEELFGNLVEWIRGPGRRHVENLVDEFLDILSAEAGTRFSNIGPAIGPAIGDGIVSIGEQFVIFAESEELDTFLNETGEIIGGLLRAGIETAIEAMFRVDAKGGGGGLFGMVEQAFRIGLDNLESLISGFVDGLVGQEGAFDRMTSAFTSAVIIGLSRTAAAFVSGFAKLQNIVSPFLNWMTSSIFDTMDFFVNIFIDGINEVIREVNSLLMSLPEGMRSALGVSTLQPIDNVNLAREAPTFEQLPTDEEALAGTMAQQIALTVGLDVEGDGPLADFIEDNVDAKVKNEKQKAENRGVRGMGTSSSGI